MRCSDLRRRAVEDGRDRLIVGHGVMVRRGTDSSEVLNVSSALSLRPRDHVLRSSARWRITGREGVSPGGLVVGGGVDQAVPCGAGPPSCSGSLDPSLFVRDRPGRASPRATKKAGDLPAPKDQPSVVKDQPSVVHVTDGYRSTASDLIAPCRPPSARPVG